MDEFEKRLAAEFEKNDQAGADKARAEAEKKARDDKMDQVFYERLVTEVMPVLEVAKRQAEQNGWKANVEIYGSPNIRAELAVSPHGAYGLSKLRFALTWDTMLMSVSEEIFSSVDASRKHGHPNMTPEQITSAKAQQIVLAFFGQVFMQGK